VHIPFCAKRCDYCAFATFTDRHHLAAPYLQAVAHEIAESVEAGQLSGVTSVFVGGGTPSLVDAAELGNVLRQIPIVPGAEVTVETNPDDITTELVATLQTAGVTRISMGVQSLDPVVLRGLGRTHVPDHVVRGVDVLHRAGLESFNLDLIMGGHGESLESWQSTVAGTIDLDPPHVSAYGLTVEASTPLADDPSRHPDDDDLAEKYLVADDLLTASGRPWYEISNWARPGHECRHNRVYWDQGNYLGFGSAAHSHLDGERWWSVRTPDRYLELRAAGQPARSGSEVLDAETRRVEALQLAIRTREGISATHLPEDPDLADLVVIEGDRAVLTRRGRLLANEVAIRLDSR
jgi:oxygen-independent coproporphyrinogen-3 oxidase